MKADEAVEQALLPPLPPRPPTPKEYFWAQVDPPTDEGYPGSIAQGRWWIAYDVAPEGSVIVADLADNFVGSRTLNAGEDALTVARQILRGKQNRVNRRIVYPSLGIV